MLSKCLYAKLNKDYDFYSPAISRLACWGSLAMKILKLSSSPSSGYIFPIFSTIYHTSKPYIALSIIDNDLTAFPFDILTLVEHYEPVRVFGVQV